MEKRKSKLSKISHQYEEVQEEKMNLQENLDRVMGQVFSLVEHTTRNHTEMKQKDLSDVQMHILEVYKQFTGITSILENLLEDNPFTRLQCKERKFVPDTVEEVATTSSSIHENGSETKQTKTEPPSLHSTPRSPILTELPDTLVATSSSIHENGPETKQTKTEPPSSHSTPRSPILPELPDTLGEQHGDFDIQSIKKSLKEFSAKLGLNKEKFLDMKDYYQKPVMNFTNCSSLLPESLPLPEYPNFEVEQSIKFEIPEKDTNTPQEHCEPTCSMLVPADDTSTSSSDLTVQPFSSKSESPLINLSEESSFDTDVDQMGFNNAQEENNLKIVSEIPRSNCSALKKLNNYISPVDNNVDNLENLASPDIKLKPTNSVIQNFISSTVEEKSKKKNKKKKKNEEIQYLELKRKELPKEGEECVFSHVESPSEFYLHIVDAVTEKIDDFAAQIHEYFEKYDGDPKYESKEMAVNQVGRFCISFIEKHNSWYRTEILDAYLNHEDDTVLIQLVDYGNKMMVSYKHLRKLTQPMTEIPILAIRCHFPLLYPPESSRLNKLTTWPLASIEGLVNISGMFSFDKQPQFFRIVYASQECNSVAIDLYNPESGSAENTVGQILLDTYLAVQIVDDYDEDNLDVELFLEDVDTIEVDNINEAITGYDPRDEARACRFTKSDGTCFKGKHCKLEHIRLPKDGVTTDKEAVFTECMYPLVLPQRGSVVTVLITGYIDVCRFLAQIVNTPVNGGKYNMDKEVCDLLVEMNSDKMVKTYEPFKVAPALGEVVVVNHWKKWSRAIVREIFMGDDQEKREVQVYVVDYGEYKKFPVKEIRKIKPQLLKLPFQAVECYIDKYEMNKDYPLKEAENFFFNNLYFHNFTATIMSTYPPFKISLKNKNGSMDVGETLFRSGLAVRRCVDVNVSDDCRLDFC